MTVTPKISMVDNSLVMQGQVILTDVPDNVILTPGSRIGLVQGAFIGVNASERKSHHVFLIGVLDGLCFMCLFRFKLWWMSQRMGTCGRDASLETQFMHLESKYGSSLSEDMDSGEEGRNSYIVFLPLLEGQFRASFQGNKRIKLEVYIESGE